MKFWEHYCEAEGCKIGILIPHECDWCGEQFAAQRHVVQEHEPLSAIELAKRVVEQDARIARLESLISKLIGD